MSEMGPTSGRAGAPGKAKRAKQTTPSTEGHFWRDYARSPAEWKETSKTNSKYVLARAVKYQMAPQPDSVEFLSSQGLLQSIAQAVPRDTIQENVEDVLMVDSFLISVRGRLYSRLAHSICQEWGQKAKLCSVKDGGSQPEVDRSRRT